jgi:predicted nucleotidyltransferase
VRHNECMLSLADASLGADERVLLESFVEKLEGRLGKGLHGVWLFGSRARGEHTSGESDVDVLVLVEDASWAGKTVVHDILDEVARDMGLLGVRWTFSIHINTPAWLAQRREVGSFFIAEVDRDKIVLGGEA